MKTIKPGKKENATPWFYKKAATCTSCGGRFQLEPGDKVSQWESQIENEEYAAFVCPTCGDTITMTRPIR